MSNFSKHVQVRATDELYGRIVGYCDAAGVSMQVGVVKLVEEGLARFENPSAGSSVVVKQLSRIRQADPIVADALESAIATIDRRMDGRSDTEEAVGAAKAAARRIRRRIGGTD